MNSEKALLVNNMNKIMILQPKIDSQEIPLNCYFKDLLKPQQVNRNLNQLSKAQTFRVACNFPMMSI